MAKQRLCIHGFIFMAAGNASAFRHAWRSKFRWGPNILTVLFHHWRRSTSRPRWEHASGLCAVSSCLPPELDPSSIGGDRLSSRQRLNAIPGPKDHKRRRVIKGPMACIGRFHFILTWKFYIFCCRLLELALQLEIEYSPFKRGRSLGSAIFWVDIFIRRRLLEPA